MKRAEQEGRLSRWSRRKQQTTEETQKEDLSLEITRQALTENEIQEASGEDQPQVEPQEPVLVDADMEPVESLTEDSDFSKFMSPGVSDELRNLALGKMFHAPIFNIRDGLDEYDDDYTSFEKLGDIITCDMRHQMEMEDKKKQEMEAKAISEAESVADEEEMEMVEDETPSITAEDEGLEELEVDESAIDELVLDELVLDEPVLVNNDIPDQSAEKVATNSE